MGVADAKSDLTSLTSELLVGGDILVRFSCHSLSTTSFNMSTRLLTEYPSLSSFSDGDLKDLLTDESFLQAFLYSMPPVKAVLDEQEKLIRDNDELASECDCMGRESKLIEY